MPSTLLLHIPCCRALPALLLEVFRLPSAFSCEAPFRRHGAYATSQELALELGLYCWRVFVRQRLVVLGLSWCRGSYPLELHFLVLICCCLGYFASFHARRFRCFGVRRGRSFLCFRGTGLRRYCAIRWVGIASAMGRRLTSVLGYLPALRPKRHDLLCLFLGILPICCVGWSFVIDNWVSIP